MAAATRTRARAGGELLLCAEELLTREGIGGSRVHRVERREDAEGVWWAFYDRKGTAWTAILVGELPKDWALLRTLEGWPV